VFQEDGQSFLLDKLPFSFTSFLKNPSEFCISWLFFKKSKIFSDKFQLGYVIDIDA
jgi:hypothetical protein